MFIGGGVEDGAQAPHLSFVPIPLLSKVGREPWSGVEVPSQVERHSLCCGTQQCAPTFLLMWTPEFPVILKPHIIHAPIKPKLACDNCVSSAD